MTTAVLFAVVILGAVNLVRLVLATWRADLDRLNDLTRHPPRR